jgi:hypothetical protein
MTAAQISAASKSPYPFRRASGVIAWFGAIARPLADARGSVRSHDGGPFGPGVVAGNGTGPRGQRPSGVGAAVWLRANGAGLGPHFPVEIANYDGLHHARPAAKLKGGFRIFIDAGRQGAGHEGAAAIQHDYRWVAFRLGRDAGALSGLIAIVDPPDFIPVQLPGSPSPR